MVARSSASSPQATAGRGVEQSLISGRTARSASSAIEQPLRRLDVHALDHLVLEALGAASEGVDQPRGSLDLRVRWRESAVARLRSGRDGSGDLPSKPSAALLRFGRETSGSSDG